MEINKTTIYKLSKEDIREVCYSLFVQSLKKLGVSSYFEVSDIKIDGYGDSQEGGLLDLWVELTITEKESL